MRQLDLHGLAGYCFKDLLFTGTPHPSVKVKLRNRSPPGTQVNHVVLMVTVAETASALAEEPLEILLNGLPILFNGIDDLLKFGKVVSHGILHFFGKVEHTTSYGSRSTLATTDVCWGEWVRITAATSKSGHIEA